MTDVQIFRMAWLMPDGSTWRSDKNDVKNLNVVANAIGFKVENGGELYTVLIKRTTPDSDSWSGKWTTKSREGRISVVMFGDLDEGAMLSGDWFESGKTYWWVAELG